MLTCPGSHSWAAAEITTQAVGSIWGGEMRLLLPLAQGPGTGCVGWGWVTFGGFLQPVVLLGGAIFHRRDMDDPLVAATRGRRSGNERW